MNTPNTPARIYSFSDAYGGCETPNPLADPDADALISTDFGSALDHPIRREFDIFGKEQVTDHLLRLILQQHDEFTRRCDFTAKQKDKFHRTGTGVFINSAPRIDRANGEPFYVATLRDGAIKIVATPLSALSPVRDDIETLSFLPNPQTESENNGLYSYKEQFRSRLAPTLLRGDAALSLTPHNPKDIPPYEKGWHIAYIDRFGNIITWVKDVEAQWQEILRVAERIDGTRDRISLAIGSDSSRTALPVHIGASLSQAEPGSISLYRNGNIDLVRRWKPGDTTQSKLRHSVFRLFQKPSIGDPVHVDDSQERVEQLTAIGNEEWSAVGKRETERARTHTVHRTAELLGGKVVGRASDWEVGPFGAVRLAEILRNRLQPGQGLRPGRPTDEAWTHRPKVPMSQETIDKLTVLADEVSTIDRKVTPMQIAAQLLEGAIQQFIERHPEKISE